MNEGEARKLIQEAMKDHPRPNFFTGKRPSGNCTNARDAIRMLRENAEEEKRPADEDPHGRQYMVTITTI